jgi:formylmethanofuran--tetrahydromethanopterin N-formyltransferase
VIDDTREAFPMAVSRLVVTADSSRLALQAAQAATGLAISIIGCACEAGLDGALPPESTPDGRPGYAVLLFSYSPEKLEEQLFLRIGQVILPSATSACFNGLGWGVCQWAADCAIWRQVPDQQAVDGRYWRIPVADKVRLDDPMGWSGVRAGT